MRGVLSCWRHSQTLTEGDLYEVGQRANYLPSSDMGAEFFGRIGDGSFSLIGEYTNSCHVFNPWPTDGYSSDHLKHWLLLNNQRVIILNRGCMPRKRTGRKWCNFSRLQCAASLETTRSLANGPSWGGGELREKYTFCVPRELQRRLSLFCLWEESVGGA